ncbi:filamentous hemagglutinin outer membrane protein [Cupriavidus basilensis OR16]|uniref:Filamentous hemagglutinin outer membrane protein n=1 Tax=Cupriavidus basilensis OR16 TaxID=1127483 RepID=H1S6C2_9BURK|nr:filamentous hemagglutinin N-terminal domain-containing protein [Cupriavidus basilensis]EHP41946.1 filamentous hemagglutinin outer membrane protein [Cupriavidus basilensis OR16]
MNMRVHYKKMPSRQTTRFCRTALTIRPLAHAIALLMAAGGTMQSAHAQQAFSRAWMAQKNMMQDTAAATGRLPNGQPAASLTNPLAQQQRASEQLQRSIDNLNVAARGIAAMQAAQAAARQAAMNDASVPDGLAEGGLKVDTNSLTAGWVNARLLNKETGQKAVDGRTQVTIQQTADKAILNWETFNVGRNTTVQFDQQPSWAVLNRVNDPQARPSQIQGQIKADGTVMIVNRNGIVFSGSSQVDTRNLVAAAAGMTDSQFRKGLYSDALGVGYVPTFANDLVTTPSTSSNGIATGDVIVQAGARIETRKPQSVTEGGGYVLLAGREAHNHGSISTPGGQVTLAAGDSFIIRKGVGTDANQDSSTRGNEVLVQRSAGSLAGRVSNSGLLQAATGDITLVGQSVEQAGVALSSTSVTTRGTLHLKAVGDAASRVILAPGSVSAILLDDSNATALDAQRDALVKDSARISDGSGYSRRDLSLVKIDASGDVDFQSGSTTLATGGQVMVDAARRTRVADRAVIDVAGAVGVSVAMESNNVMINVQGNEQRDAPLNRDSKLLNNANIWIDRRTLVRVAAGTNGYATERMYTGGGLLEVSGYLSTGGHSIGEWAAQGGTVAFSGGELVTQAGSGINLSGGSLNVQSGSIRQTWLKGADGRLYNLATAPADNLYTGLYRGFEDTHARWGKNTTEYYYSPLIAPGSRLENGYTVGRDAGRLVVATQSAVLEGNIDTTVFQGDRQREARDAGLDGYKQSQIAVARPGQLIVGQLTPIYDSKTGMLRDSPQALVKQVEIGTVQGIADGLALTDALPDERKGKLRLDAGWINGLGLGALKLYARDGIDVGAAVQVAAGGDLALHATQVDVRADLAARGGRIALGNMINQYTSSAGGSWLDVPVAAIPAKGYTPGVSVGQGVTLDGRGQWSNLELDATRIGGLPYLNGGVVTISSTGDVTLGTGSVLDVSSGAALLAGNKIQGGRGGNITLLSNQNDMAGKGSGALRMDGELRAYGVKGGGTLTIDTGVGIAIGGGLLADSGLLPAGQSVSVNLTLAQSVTLPAGTVLASDFTYTADTVAPGQAMQGNPVFSTTRKVTLQAPWLVPRGTTWNFAVIDDKGRFYSNGNIAPAGTVLVGTSGDLAPGYVVPADVFPNGIPVPEFNSTLLAGTPLPKEVVLAEGARLLAGTKLPGAVAVKPLLVIGNAVFQSGFSRYAVAGQQGVQVARDANLAVAMPVLRFDAAAGRAVPSGAESAQMLERWLPPLWQEDPLKATLTQRGGADLALSAGSVYTQAPLVVGQGAIVTVDPGRALTLQGNGQITVDGTLNAWGGNIALLPGKLGTGNEAGRPNGIADAMSIWIGNDAVLDAAGRAITAVDARGHVYGNVGQGGTIEIGARHNLDATVVDAADAFVVVRPGARIDASGASARLDLPGLGATQVASDGGVIALSSLRGLFLDGSLRAAAGGPGAAGGTLALNLETPAYGPVDNYTQKSPSVEDAVRAARELVVAQTQGSTALAAGLRPGDRDAALLYGTGRIGVDRIGAGGFDNVALLANGVISFDGNVNLAVGQSLRLTTSAVALAANAAAGTQVNLAAPYVRLAGTTRVTPDFYYMPNPVVTPAGVALVSQGARLQVEADLLDLVGAMQIGVRGLIKRNADTSLAVERAAFDEMTLRSRGDLRMYGAASLNVPGNLTLAAAQIYPGMGDSGSVTVGQRSFLDKYGIIQREFDPARHLNIERMGDALPAMPYSVFGRLSFGAPTINQGGVVRAPLGTLELGSAGYGAVTEHLNLLPGSVSSISANGLVMPYGGSLDGLSYLHDGKDVVFNGVGNGPAKWTCAVAAR